MDIYEILYYAVPALIIIGLIIYCGKKILQWSDNNHAEITEHKALIIKKEHIEKIRRNKSVSLVSAITDKSSFYYITFRTADGKKHRCSVKLIDHIKTREGDEGILRLKGTRFVSFEKTEESTKSVNDSTDVSVKAKVKSKNIIARNSNSVTLIEVASDTLKGKIVFETEKGEELSFTFIGKSYREILDGDKGILTYQGENFISFERE